MSIFSKLSKTLLPAAIGFATGGPAGAFAGTVGSLEAQRAEKKIKQQQQAQERDISGMELFNNQSPNIGAVQVPPYRPSTQQAGQGGFFGGVSDFFRGAG